MRCREAELFTDGWCLEDSEARHRENPETFQIPSLVFREGLLPGDLAKLIFRIALEPDGEAVERMWVVVRERLEDGGYLGQLDNQPSSIARNDFLCLGTEVLFYAHHIIDFGTSDDVTKAAISRPE